MHAYVTSLPVLVAQVGSGVGSIPVAQKIDFETEKAKIEEEFTKLEVPRALSDMYAEALCIMCVQV